MDPASAVRRRAQARRARARARAAARRCCCSTSRPTTSTSTASRALEELLLEAAPASIVITHDRAFLDRVATRIVELDRGAAALLSRQLHRLRGAPGATSSPPKRGREPPLRQVLGAGGGLDPQGHRGAPHAQRGPRQAPRGALRDERTRAARAARQHQAHARRGRALGQAGRGARRTSASGSASARSCATSRLRIMRGDRIGLIGPNGAGKTHAAPADPRHARARRGHRAARHQPAGRVLRPDARAARSRADRRRHDQPRARTGSRSAAARKHVMSYLADFLFPPRRAQRAGRDAVGRRAQPAAARAPVRAARQPAGARRADQRPRHRVARAARGDAAGIRRHAAARQPRPRVPRQRRHADARRGGRRELARVRRRLQRLARAAADRRARSAVRRAVGTRRRASPRASRRR